MLALFRTAGLSHRQDTQILFPLARAEHGSKLVRPRQWSPQTWCVPNGVWWPSKLQNATSFSEQWDYACCNHVSTKWDDKTGVFTVSTMFIAQRVQQGKKIKRVEHRRMALGTFLHQNVLTPSNIHVLFTVHWPLGLRHSWDIIMNPFSVEWRLNRSTDRFAEVKLWIQTETRSNLRDCRYCTGKLGQRWTKSQCSL